MLIATWNVNSVRAREERLLRWLDRNQPDALCLQELKTEGDAFPFAAVREVGYEAAVLGQKTYNGVAILAKSAPEDVELGFGDDIDDPQARCIAATVEGIRIVSVYVPNGSTPESDKYAYKQLWLDRLVTYIEERQLTVEPSALLGDFNIVPEERDVNRPDEWEGSVLFNPEMRRRFQCLLDLGMVDAFRQCRDEDGLYSWWDYRQLGFPKNNGLRIDHILVSDDLADRCTGARIDRDERKGQKPSDHAPVLVELDWP
jgi:exodeoxyribonuclease-3